MIKTKEQLKIKTEKNREGKEKLFLSDLSDFEGKNEKLKMFSLAELLPGEEKTVEFEITEDTLAFVGADGKRKAEKGKFRVFIGESSETEAFAEFELI